MTPPRYTHGCEHCVFLGDCGLVDRGVADLYFCSNSYGGTLLSRWSSNPPDYWSVPATLLDESTEEQPAFVRWVDSTGLRLAADRARKRGLLPKM